MNEFEKIRAWGALKEEIGKIYDYKTKCLYYKALLARACSEWGFNPDKPGVNIQDNYEPELDDWEKEFVEDIKDTVIFGFDVREKKRIQEKKNALARMKIYIDQGGTLDGIPEEIRSPDTIRLYYDALYSIGNDLIDLAHSVLN